MVQSPRAAIALGQRLYRLARYALYTFIFVLLTLCCSQGIHLPDEDGSDSDAPVQFMDIAAMDTQLSDPE